MCADVMMWNLCLQSCETLFFIRQLPVLLDEGLSRPSQLRKPSSLKIWVYVALVQAVLALLTLNYSHSCCSDAGKQNIMQADFQHKKPFLVLKFLKSFWTKCKAMFCFISNGLMRRMVLNLCLKQTSSDKWFTQLRRRVEEKNSFLYFT